MAEGNAAAWFVARHVREGRGERTAFIDPHGSASYRDVLARAGAFAAGLARAGIGRERRIALLLRDTTDFPVAFWGALMAGVVPVPINTLLAPDLIEYILADSRAELLVASPVLLAPLRARLGSRLGSRLGTLPFLRAVVVAEDGAPQGDETRLSAFLDTPPIAAPVAASPDEVAFWLYSSGSTGAPKGVRHVHGSLRATADTYGAQVLGIAPDDVVLSVAKLFFAYGLGNAMTFPMSVGACAVLCPDRPTPEGMRALMRAHRPSVFCAVPTFYAAALEAAAGAGPGFGSDRLRRCVSAGEALPAPVGRRWRELTGVAILDGVGSTEMLHIFLSNRPGDVRDGAAGRAVPGYDLRLVDDADAAVPDGQPGELLVRGPSAGDGYWNQRAKGRHTFAGEWTRTGDQFVRDADGIYRCLGRVDDMLKVSGIWVSPYDVEAALLSHEAVAEAAVVGHADVDGLVKPRAFVVPRPGVSLDASLVQALQTHVKARLGAWTYPRWIEAIDALPKTATGKIQRFRLRDPA